MSPAAGITSSETSFTTTATLASQPQTNQLQISGMTYDADGRVTQDNLGNTFTYDAEGRMIAGGGYSYAYDGTGNRVAKWNGSTGRLYWPDLKGRPINETDLSGLNPTRNVYFKGKQLARQDASGNWTYNLRDHLGSTRMILDGSGNVLYQSDYYPFGGTAYTAGSTTNLYGFTGYEADTETSSNYAIYRNQAPILGRFLRPDPSDGSYHLGNPQSLNRYSYVENKPLLHTDRFGLDDDGDDDGGGDSSGGSGDNGACSDVCDIATGGDGPDGQNTQNPVNQPTQIGQNADGSPIFYMQTAMGESDVLMDDTGITVDTEDPGVQGGIDPAPSSSKLEATKQKLTRAICKSSPTQAVVASAFNGAVIGGIQTGLEGAFFGAFGGGVGAIPGGLLGLFVGGVVGGAGGVLKGGATALACSAIGAYGG